jgi:Zn finger protein HypA/HybF involved in hydrogenase expression
MKVSEVDGIATYRVEAEFSLPLDCLESILRGVDPAENKVLAIKILREYIATAYKTAYKVRVGLRELRDIVEDYINRKMEVPCQCNGSARADDPCTMAATGPDGLCDFCREFRMSQALPYACTVCGTPAEYRGKCPSCALLGVI